MTPSTATEQSLTEAELYPDSDGKPMSDNTVQHRWIDMLFHNINSLFAERTDVFVAADLMWYAVEGHPRECAAPDVMVAFGRPKVDRGSYKQWREGGIPPAVVFEVLSPANTDDDMAKKSIFYEDHAVEEYYIIDPDENRLDVFLRQGTVFRRQDTSRGFTSPRLGIRFDASGPEVVVYRPNGEAFRNYLTVEAALRRAEYTLALSRKVRRGQATAEEVAELERLEDQGEG